MCSLGLYLARVTRTLVCIGALAPAAGCNPESPNDDPYALRILAVRATPPTPAPGSRVDLELLTGNGFRRPGSPAEPAVPRIFWMRGTFIFTGNR